MEWLTLNVGGRVFSTTRSTLIAREPEGFLAKLCLNDESCDMPSTKDANGAILIDRDGDYFAAVLNYLRHGKVIVDRGLSAAGLLEEAEFYNLPEMIAVLQGMVKAEAQAAETANATRGKFKEIYRLFESDEEELAQMLSNLSDGWRFETLTYISSPYDYGQKDGDKNEFVVVLSKRVPDTE